MKCDAISHATNAISHAINATNAISHAILHSLHSSHATNAMKTYQIQLSECLKTVGNFPGGTENKSNVFLHDICKRILLSQFFFRSCTKKK